MRTRSTRGRGTEGGEAATLRERLGRAVRPKVLEALTQWQATKETLKSAASEVGERFKDGGEAVGKVRGAAQEHWQSARLAAVDVARYAVRRLTAQARPSEDFRQILERVLRDSGAELLEMKKNVATAIADEKRLVRDAEQEDANAREWLRRVELARKAGDASLVESAQASAEVHRRAASHLHAEWQGLAKEVAAMKRELRSFHQALEDARAAQRRMATTARARDAKERAARDARRMRELAGILAVMSVLDSSSEVDDRAPDKP